MYSGSNQILTYWLFSQVLNILYGAEAFVCSRMLFEVISPLYNVRARKGGNGKQFGRKRNVMGICKH